MAIQTESGGWPWFNRERWARDNISNIRDSSVLWSVLLFCMLELKEWSLSIAFEGDECVIVHVPPEMLIKVGCR